MNNYIQRNHNTMQNNIQRKIDFIEKALDNGFTVKKLDKNSYEFTKKINGEIEKNTVSVSS